MKLKLVSFKETFTDAPWSSPESNLSESAYCAVCLVNRNKPGQEPKKKNCHYPYKSKPGAPVNKNALRSIGANLGGARTAASFSLSSEERAKFERLRKAAGIGDGKEKE